ncbi:MAG: alpha/beta hydrolase [Gammaproteobacteria bacterium]|nr:alpha/beta hydrolase [Gammaproteobacteria bacterium]
MNRTSLKPLALAGIALLAAIGVGCTTSAQNNAPPPAEAETGGAASIPLWKTLPEVPPLPPADTSGYAPVNGVRLYYAVFNRGGGEPVILLHGGLGSSEDWGFEVPLLGRAHEVIVVDCRGRGRSTLSIEPLSYALMTSDTLALMDYLKLTRASIDGWSDGGIIGLLMAVHHPDRIDKLFAFGAVYSRSGYSGEPSDPALAARYMARAKATYRRLSPTPDDFPKLLAALKHMYAIEPELDPAEIGTIKAPTIIADGQYEQFITRAHTEALAWLIPGATLVIIPNVSHGGPIQDPAAFHRAVASLLGGANKKPF